MKTQLFAQKKGYKIIQDDHLKMDLVEWPDGTVIMKPYEKESMEERRFFEGPLKQYWFLQIGIGNHETYVDAREEMKEQFNTGYRRDKNGELKTYGKSTKGLSNKGFREFLGRIERYFEENGYIYPNSEDYNRWVNSAPLKGELYPRIIPLVRNYIIMLNEVDKEKYKKWVKINNKLIQNCINQSKKYGKIN